MRGEYIRKARCFRADAPSTSLPVHRSCSSSWRAAIPAQNWREVYELARLELDISNLPGRVKAALQAIQQRLRQKKEALNQKEREELGDALRALVEVVRRRGAQGQGHHVEME